MSAFMKRDVPLLIVTVVGVTVMAEYFFAIKQLADGVKTLTEWVSIIFGFTLALGAINMVIINSRYVIRRAKERWFDSLLIVVGVVAVTIAGFIPPFTRHWTLKWLYDYIYTPPAGTLYGMLTFYMISAAYRAVKARNLESAAFTLSAFFLVMKNAPIAVSAWRGFTDIGIWISDVPAAAGWRAFYIGAAIGTVALTMRTFLWRERGAITGGE